MSRTLINFENSSPCCKYFNSKWSSISPSLITVIQKVRFVHNYMVVNERPSCWFYRTIKLHFIIDTVVVSLALLLAVLNAAGIIIISENDVLGLAIKLIACHW